MVDAGGPAGAAADTAVAPPDHAVELRHVHKRYATRRSRRAAPRVVDALHDVSLAVARGEFVSIVGPNGSSMRRISGSCISARPMPTRCCMPPDSSPG